MNYSQWDCVIKVICNFIILLFIQMPSSSIKSIYFFSVSSFSLLALLLTSFWAWICWSTFYCSYVVSCLRDYFVSITSLLSSTYWLWTGAWGWVIWVLGILFTWFLCLSVTGGILSTWPTSRAFSNGQRTMTILDGMYNLREYYLFMHYSFVVSNHIWWAPSRRLWPPNLPSSDSKTMKWSDFQWVPIW